MIGKCNNSHKQCSAFCLNLIFRKIQHENEKNQHRVDVSEEPHVAQRKPSQPLSKVLKKKTGYSKIVMKLFISVF